MLKKTTEMYIKVLMMVACMMVTLFATAHAEGAGEKGEKKQSDRVEKTAPNTMGLPQADANGDDSMKAGKQQAGQDKAEKSKAQDKTEEGKGQDKADEGKEQDKAEKGQVQEKAEKKKEKAEKKKWQKKAEKKKAKGGKKQIKDNL